VFFLSVAWFGFLVRITNERGEGKGIIGKRSQKSQL